MVGIGAKGEVFAWGRVKCATPNVVKPGLVMLLPGPKGEGSLNVCLQLHGDQMDDFYRLMMMNG